jgi:aldose 1-epimerase
MNKKNINLVNKFWNIEILPSVGAAIGFGKILLNNEWVDFFRPAIDKNVATECASYNLMPWSNRVKDTLFIYKNKKYFLRKNPSIDPKNALHGTVYEFPFNIASQSKTHINLTFNSNDFYGVNFPWNFLGETNYKIADNKLYVEYAITNIEKNDSFPAGFGIHPFFVNHILGESPKITIPASKNYELDGFIPSEKAKDISKVLDFRNGKKLDKNILLDDNLTGIDHSKPITFDYNKVKINITFDKIFKNLIVYSPPNEDFFAVEPVTNVNDGFNRYNQNLDSGIFILKPNERVSGVIKIEMTTEK